MPEPNPTLPFIPPQRIQYLWDNVKKGTPDECWEWQRKRGLVDGYGTFRVGYVNVRAHRVAYFAQSGVDPGINLVLHRCDNRLCCNIAHLFLGDKVMNRQDCVNKGRQARGERNNKTKMTTAKVMEMRRLYAAGGETHTSLARRFGIKRPSARRILIREAWKHV